MGGRSRVCTHRRPVELGGLFRGVSEYLSLSACSSHACVRTHAWSGLWRLMVFLGEPDFVLEKRKERAFLPREGNRAAY